MQARLFPFKILLLLVVLPYSAEAQIPNPGFELWTAGEPDGWATSNSSPFITVTQSIDAHGGISAARGEVIEIYPGINLQPLLQSGPGGTGFPISQRYAALRGFYKFGPIGGDRFGVIVLFTKYDTTLVAVGAILDSTPVALYTEFVVNMTYYTSDIPDMANIQISIVGPVTGSDFHVGSTMHVDDLSFSGIVAVDDQQGSIPGAFVLHQNYPNPFNPSTKIRFDLPAGQAGVRGSGFVTLKVYNVLGQEVATLVNEELNPGTYEVPFDARNLASGVYTYRLTAGSYVAVKKMVLLK